MLFLIFLGWFYCFFNVIELIRLLGRRFARPSCYIEIEEIYNFDLPLKNRVFNDNHNHPLHNSSRYPFSTQKAF